MDTWLSHCDSCADNKTGFSSLKIKLKVPFEYECKIKRVAKRVYNILAEV